MLQPHPVVLKATVDKYYRLALTYFYVSKLNAVGGNPFDFISHGQSG
jgi:hypothetical protein